MARVPIHEPPEQDLTYSEEEESQKIPPHESTPNHDAVTRTEEDAVNEPKEDSNMDGDTMIVVMGVTGSGKSSFISLLTDESVGVGHDLESYTTDAAMYYYRRDAMPTIGLVDTPGFNDTYRSDVDVLRDLAVYLTRIYTKKTKIAGLIYLHRITDIRMQGSSLRNLRVFEKLCGNRCFPNVVLVTTMWGNLKSTGADENIGMTRETELEREDKYWGHMVKGGSRVMRHSGDQQSAKAIVSYLLDKNEPIVLDIQREMVDEERPLDETTAGKFAQEDLLEVRKKCEREVKEFQESIDEALKEKDDQIVATLLEQQLENQARISKLDSERENLRITQQALVEEKERESAARKRDIEHNEAPTDETLKAKAAEVDLLAQQLAEMQDEIALREREQRDTATAKSKREQRAKVRKEQELERKLEKRDQWWELQTQQLMEHIHCETEARKKKERELQMLLHTQRRKKSPMEAFMYALGF